MHLERFQALFGGLGVRRIKALHDSENLNAEIYSTFRHIFYPQPGLSICYGRTITDIYLWSCGVVLLAHHLDAEDEYGRLGPPPLCWCHTHG
jgi:hypothetical protein